MLQVLVCQSLNMYVRSISCTRWFIDLWWRNPVIRLKYFCTQHFIAKRIDKPMGISIQILVLAFVSYVSKQEYNL